MDSYQQQWALNDIDYGNLKISNDTWYCKLCIKEILAFCSKQTNIDENDSVILILTLIF